MSTTNSFSERAFIESVNRRAILTAAYARNKVVPTPVQRSEEDCPARVQFLAELAERRRMRKSLGYR